MICAKSVLKLVEWSSQKVDISIPIQLNISNFHCFYDTKLNGTFSSTEWSIEDSTSDRNHIRLKFNLRADIKLKWNSKCLQMADLITLLQIKLSFSCDKWICHRFRWYKLLISIAVFYIKITIIIAFRTELKGPRLHFAIVFICVCGGLLLNIFTRVWVYQESLKCKLFTI